MRGSAGGGGLTTLTGDRLMDEVHKRRASYQRSLSRLKELRDDGAFEAVVHSHLDDVQAMRGVPLEVTMFAAVVTDEHGGYHIRGVYASHATAKQRLEMEVAAKTHVPLEWHDFGHGISSSQSLGGLRYETDCVKVIA